MAVSPLNPFQLLTRGQTKCLSRELAKPSVTLLLASLILGCGENSPSVQDAVGAADSSTPDRASSVTLDFAANALRWQSKEFQPTTLSTEQAQAELAWFTAAAEPFRGMNIKVVSEALTTHAYESEVLAKAFYEITGIQVTHDLIQEGDVIERLQTQIQSGENIYDAYVNDCLLYTSPSPRDRQKSRMPSSA